MANKPTTKHAGGAGRPPKYDYDAEEWYQAIYELAFNGCKDEEIAFNLQNKIGISLTPDTFNLMKNGKYPFWTAEENASRSRQIKRELARARNSINTLVRSTYLQAALGKIKTKSTSTTRRRMQIDGQLTDNEIIQTTESENQMAPNMQALAMWLYHYDPEWKAVQRGLEEERNGVPEAQRGVDISKWIIKENEK